MHRRNKSSSPPRRRMDLEDIAYCEGSSEPLQIDRTAELAMECWNLRKTVLEQSAQSLKIKNDLKISKHLIKNLQQLVNDTQAENNARNKELFDMKASQLDYEKQVHDLTQTQSVTSSNLRKYRNRVETLEKRELKTIADNKVIVSKHLETIEKLTAEINTFNEENPKLIKQYSGEISKLTKDHATLKVVTDEQKTRINELEESLSALRTENETLKQQSKQQLVDASINHQMIYRELHSKLETSLADKAVLRRIALEKDHVNNQLMGYILREGLQYPEITPLYPDDKEDERLLDKL